MVGVTKSCDIYWSNFMCSGELCAKKQRVWLLIHDTLCCLPSQGIILVYDITSQKSFDNITKWLQNIEMVRLQL